MTVLEQITTDLAAITDDAVTKIAGYLQPIEKDDKPLGLVVSAHVHRLWALAVDYQRESMRLAYDVNYNTDNPADRPPIRQRARYLDTLADVVRDMAWLEMRQEVGESAWGESVGLREGFMLVATKEDSVQAVNVAAINIGEVISKILGSARASEEKEKPVKERKPS